VTGSLPHRLTEALDSLWDNLVDPREAWYDDAERVGWLPLAAAGGGRSIADPLASEVQLAEIRDQCRALAATNEFAINGHENRISYIVGSGHTYRAAPRKGAVTSSDVPARVQAVLDEFLERSQWGRRQQELVRRLDRDGEAFLRFFATAGGALEIRFVEPGQVATPPALAGDPASSFGIGVDPHDVERPLVYYIDGQAVEATEIQHRKLGVDSNVKRGLPLFYPVRKNLRRAEKLLRNMSTVAEIQSAIALVRKHQRRTRSTVEQFVSGQADHASTGDHGRVRYSKRIEPGTILDVDAAVDYDFPAAGIDAGRFVLVLQAELRAIASRLVMPEFMLTSDASNANFASTMVAEGPAIKMFERLQADQASHDLAVMWRAVEVAAAAGRLPIDVRQLVEIQVGRPSLHVRDALKEAEANRIAFEAGVLSPQTWSQRLGLDYEQEQTNLRQRNADENATDD
jgi:capsid protein